ncbi:MAG: trehalose-phosphatase [Sphingobium sp.]|nr:MAG: trehalose-phosphatase [Sphingobium sp.]
MPVLPPPSPSLLDGAALFLDFDGTLVPLTEAPDAVRVDAELCALLRRRRDALDGRLAIVSGRSVATLRDSFGLGDFVLAGSHGLEIAYPGSDVIGPARLSGVDEAEQAFTAFASDKPGLLVERKTLSVGLHFRMAPEWETACHALAEELAARTGLFIQAGKMMFELRPGGANKGTALAHLIAQPPMAGGTPLFFGDDVTDEEGFETARAHGGNGVLVGPARATAAQWHLEQVAAVRHYLDTHAA